MVRGLFGGHFETLKGPKKDQMHTSCTSTLWYQSRQFQAYDVCFNRLSTLPSHVFSVALKPGACKFHVSHHELGIEHLVVIQKRFTV